MSTVVLTSGLLNLPGATHKSKEVAEALLTKDNRVHHSVFSDRGLGSFHNHLSHHILAAYDLGASSDLLNKIYEDEAKIQRPLVISEASGVPQPGSITEENWTQFLGVQR